MNKVGEQPGDPYDGIVLDYANPLTGGPTLPTMDCQIHMLRAGEKTKSHRHTSSVIYHVWRGSGVSYVGDKRYEWEQGDSFVVPLWNFHRHENTSKDPAIFFVMTDKPLMDAIGHYREDAQAITSALSLTGRGMPRPPSLHHRKESFMFTLEHKLNPDEFIKTFFEANRQDHQRPAHPWEEIFRERQMHPGTTARLGQGALLLHQTSADQRIFDPV